MKYCFGVDVGGTTVKLGLFTEDGSLLDQWEIATRKEENGKYVLEDIASSLLSKMQEKSLDQTEVIGIGIGVPGPVTNDGVVNECVNIGWGVVNVAKELNTLTGFHVKVGNDANVAALGEAWQGGGKGYEDVVLVTLGTGVGGGIILDGRILTGSSGAAGEIGHILVNPMETDACNCGKRGCLEQYASATGIVKEAKRILSSSSMPSQLRSLDQITAKDIFDYAKKEDAVALKAVDQLGRNLAMALSYVAQTIDPQVFVVGGGVSKAGSILIDSISKYYDGFVMKALKGKKICLASLGNNAGIYGSAKMALGDEVK